MYREILKNYILSENDKTVEISKKNFESLCDLIESYVDEQTMEMVAFFDSIDRDMMKYD